MSKMKIITTNSTLIKRIDDLGFGEVFKVVRYGSEKIFMATAYVDIVESTGIKQINAVCLNDGTLWEIDPSWHVIPVNGTFKESGDDDNG